MASVLPSSKSDLLAFCQARISAWSSNAAVLGLSSGEIDALEAAIGDAGTTATSLVLARAAAKAATTADNTASAALRTLASEAVARIKFIAESTGNPTIYATAMIPPPSAPGPTVPPAQPTMLRAGLEPGGALTVSWKAANAPGPSVVYQVYRKLPGMPAFVLIGFSGGRDKFFTDATLPAGSAFAQYMVQGTRGTVNGTQSEILTATFGVGGGSGGGFAFTTTAHDEPVKLAA